MGKNKDSRKVVMMVIRAKNNEQILNHFRDDRKWNFEFLIRKLEIW